jgi:hypothetical protein
LIVVSALRVRDDYLSKPLEPVQVHAMLEHWIAGPEAET